eukprot:2022571-Rhodomonas_salina.2
MGQDEGLNTGSTGVKNPVRIAGPVPRFPEIRPHWSEFKGARLRTHTSCELALFAPHSPVPKLRVIQPPAHPFSRRGSLSGAWAGEQANTRRIGTQLPRFLGSPGSLAVDALREVCYDSILQNAKTHSITIINSNQGSNFDPGLAVSYTHLRAHETEADL